MATTKDRRLANRARRLLRSEFRWLQKAVFALSKAEDAREKLAEIEEDDTYDLEIVIGGKKHDVAQVGVALREVIESRMQEQRAELRERMQQR